MNSQKEKTIKIDFNKISSKEDIDKLDMNDENLLEQLGLNPIPDIDANLSLKENYNIMREEFFKFIIKSSIIDKQKEHIFQTLKDLRRKINDNSNN